MKTNMNNRWMLSGMVVLAMVIAGCDIPPKEVSQDKSITSDRLDIQNFNRASTELTNKMLTTPRVQDEIARISANSGGKRPLVQVSRIKNDTGLKINMVDYLVTPMEEVLINSGKLDFFSDDKVAQQLGAAGDMLNGTQARLPNLVLNGTVTRLGTYNGDLNQQTYRFHLELVDPAGGNKIWVGTSSDIIKQVRGKGATL